jgi:hypothetical protein
MYFERLLSRTWGKARIFLYLNLNNFASKYLPIYESKVSKAPQSVASPKDCNYAIFLRKRQCKCYSRFHHNAFPRYTGRGKTALTTYLLLLLPLRATCHHYGCFRQNIRAHFEINMDYISPFSPLNSQSCENFKKIWP